MTIARKEVLDPTNSDPVHIYSRTVRRCFLCGVDPTSGNDYEHRKDWIEERIRFLVSVFGIDCIGLGVMSNHYHTILRTHPERVQGWDGIEIAKRWTRRVYSIRTKGNSGMQRLARKRHPTHPTALASEVDGSAVIVEQERSVSRRFRASLRA